METLKKELQTYFNLNIYKLEQERKELNDSYFRYFDYLQTIKELSEEERQEKIIIYNKNEEERRRKQEELTKTIESKTIEKDLIYNNIIYLFYTNYHDIIINILDKCKNKNIGEKTKEKIQEEIKEELKKDKLYTSIYFSFGQYSHDLYNLSITIYKNEEDQKAYSYYRVNFEITISSYYHEEDQKKYGNYFTYNTERHNNIIHNNQLWNDSKNYQYVENTKKVSQEILKKCKKRIEKVNKLIEQAKETRKENNNLLNNYKINSYDFINIKCDQTL